MKRLFLLLFVFLSLCALALADGAPYDRPVYDSDENGVITQVDWLYAEESYEILDRMAPLPGTAWDNAFDTVGQIQLYKVAYTRNGQEYTGWIMQNPEVLVENAHIADSAFVLCESLSMRAEASTSAQVVCTLTYGDTFAVTGQSNEWLRASYTLADGSSLSGWVRGEYVLLDPQYFTSSGETPVYAYPGQDAPRVGLLSDGQRQPIIAYLEGYTVISLRGASGFVRE